MKLNAKSNLRGMRFEKLVALQRSPNRHGKITWECLCDCGNLTYAPAQRLLGLHKIRAVSCGCYRGAIRAFPNTPYGNTYVILDQYRNGARRRGLKWELSEEEALSLLVGDCFYCGCPPSAVSDRLDDAPFIHGGIDRLDPSIGYETANSVSCCASCNYLKGGRTKQEFIEHVKRIFANLEKNEACRCR